MSFYYMAKPIAIGNDFRRFFYLLNYPALTASPDLENIKTTFLSTTLKFRFGPRDIQRNTTTIKFDQKNSHGNI